MINLFIFFNLHFPIFKALPRDEFGYYGGFPFQEVCLVKIFEMYIDDSITISRQAIIYILAQALSLVWEKTIAHEENKKRASVVVPIVTRILQRFAADLESKISFPSLSLLSFRYFYSFRS